MIWKHGRLIIDGILVARIQRVTPRNKVRWRAYVLDGQPVIVRGQLTRTRTKQRTFDDLLAAQEWLTTHFVTERLEA